MNKFVTFIVSALLTATAQAAPASQESVEALLIATKIESMVGGMYANVEQMMRQTMANESKGKALSAEEQRVLDAVPAKFVKVMREEMSWSKMRPMYLQIYQDSFTQEEVDGLLAFYGSPAGQAVLVKMPVVMQKSMVAMQSIIGPITKKMEIAVQEARAEAKQSK